MSELADLVKTPVVPEPFRSARVISVDKHTLTVDLSSGAAGTTITATDSCNPRPNDTVLIAMDGSRPVAIGVIGGPYRQVNMIATSSTSTTVTGLINGVSTTVPKIGSFTVTNGDEIPLDWAWDGSEARALVKAGVPYTPPGGGGGGSSGGGSGGGTTPSTYTTSYAAKSSGSVLYGGSRQAGDLFLNFPFDYGYYQYGYWRFGELSGKKIISGRIYLPRRSGSGSVTLQVAGAPGSSSSATGGWVSLPLTRINDLIARPSFQMVEMRITGSGSLKGIPGGGTIQITWK